VASHGYTPCVPLTFYDVESDPDRFQYFLLEDPSAADHYHFDGRPLSQVWRPPAVVSYQPHLPEGDFWDFGLGSLGTVFAVRPEALDRPGLRQYLTSVGELLPLLYRDREFAVWNITECIDALDADASEWLHYDDGARFRVATPRFRPDRLGWNVFKVPEIPTSIFAWIDDRTERKQLFRHLVDDEQLTGLVFREVYVA
jgi:hypothetical protein